jgi:hypothetical protein
LFLFNNRRDCGASPNVSADAEMSAYRARWCGL